MWRHRRKPHTCGRGFNLRYRRRRNNTTIADNCDDDDDKTARSLVRRLPSAWTICLLRQPSALRAHERATAAPPPHLSLAATPRAKRRRSRPRPLIVPSCAVPFLPAFTLAAYRRSFAIARQAHLAGFSCSQARAPLRAHDANNELPSDTLERSASVTLRALPHTFPAGNSLTESIKHTVSLDNKQP